MEETFNRLTDIQKKNINKQMFCIAYQCVTVSKGNPDTLFELILTKTENNNKLTADLLRYCKLIQSIR